ncbi:MAG: amino acid adenylation domain-containing protein [Firmicutes bacterium]|nr:amino acid adenylation domain-containing protein [Bacillota bacterium]
MKTKTVLDYVERSAERYPDKKAIFDETFAYTYGELIALSKRVGTGLSNKLIRGRRPITVFMDKGCDCLVAMLGILYSGRAYVPMDIKTPLDRLNAIMATVGDGIILTSEKDKRFLDKIGYEGEQIILEDLLAEFKTADETLLERIRGDILDTDLMYILFTSGSTGVPKGVAILNRSVVDYVESFSKAIGTKSDDIVGNQVPFYADMSLKDIYMTLHSGGSICVIPQKFFMAPKLLLDYLEKNNVTTLYWVPTAYGIVQRFDGLSELSPRTINKIVFSGESMPISVFRYWRKHYPEATYIQLYGPTEITGACTYFVVDRDYDEGEIIPIGKPFDNTGIVLLDNDNKPIYESGEEGEICVYGSCLAAGYYNNPEKTEEAFIQNPLVKGYQSLMYRTGDIAKWNEQGELVFISRKDYQIKHGGRRIELGEIETAAQCVEGVMACCCVQRRSQDAIILYYVGDIEPKGIMLGMREKLPQYMIPSECRKLESMPLLPNGKTDRKTIDEWANA